MQPREVLQQAVGRLAEEGMTSERIAEKVGVSSSTLRNIIDGRSTPSLDVRLRIEDMFAIPQNAWPRIAGKSRPDLRKDYAGQRIGSIVVLSLVEPDGPCSEHGLEWNCVCDCGERFTRRTNSLSYAIKNGQDSACPRCNATRSPGRPSANPGRKSLVRDEPYGLWTVLERAKDQLCGGKLERYWKCRCACGTERAVKESALIAETSRSCGCAGKSKRVSPFGRFSRRTPPAPVAAPPEVT
jgi:plasmid maintenance system antidote protein VapI